MRAEPEQLTQVGQLAELALGQLGLGQLRRKCWLAQWIAAVQTMMKALNLKALPKLQFTTEKKE